MRSLVVVLMVLVGCSNKSDTRSTNADEPSPCADELRTIIVPALDHTLTGNDADGFHAATAKFQVGTMCGPDIAAMMRDWEAALREPDTAKSAAQRRDILTRLQELVKSQPDWATEARTLEPFFAKAKPN